MTTCSRSRSLALAVLAGPLMAFGCERSTSSPVTTSSEDASAPALDASREPDGGGSVDASDRFDAALPSPLTTLSQTGLFRSILTKELAPTARAFTPVSPLWSDGADKQRIMMLPPGARIDTSDMDRWRFPVGARFFKEFAKGGKRLETRLIARVADTGNPEIDFFMGAFAWRDDESDADLVASGKIDVRGTEHDIPAQSRCATCHVGEPGRILGFSALQLGSVALTSLATEGLLTNPPSASISFPGAGTNEGTALAYLHANCGHCHNPSGSAWPDTQMVLRVGVNETSTPASKLYETTVGAALNRFQKPGFSLRIAPGDAGASAVVYRMSVRGSPEQMPPFATEHPDPTGITAVSAWINALP